VFAAVVVVTLAIITLLKPDSAPPRPVATATESTPAKAIVSAATSTPVDDHLALATIRQHLREFESLPRKKLFATADQLALATGDIDQLRAIKGHDAAELSKQMESRRRILYASALEHLYLEKGMDVTVRAEGNQNRQLRMTYVLMSRPLVYKLHNHDSFEQAAGIFGFRTVIYSDVFDKYWSIDLAEE